MAFSTFNAAPDASLSNSGIGFSTVRGAASGVANSIYPYAYVGGQDRGAGSYSIYRLGLTFDTTSIPSDAVVTAVTLWLYPTNHTAAQTLHVVAFSSGGSIDASDYGGFTLGTSLGSRAFTVGAINNSYSIALPTSAVVRAGTTELGVICNADQANSSSEIDVSVNLLSTIRTVDYGGGSTFWPRLEVTWFPATQTVSPTLAGQSGGVLSSASSESVTVEPTIAGQSGGVEAPAVSNAGGDVFATLLGVASGILPPAVLVGGVATMRPSIVGAESGVMGGTTGPRPRLLGPFSVLVEAPLREGDQVTVTALLRRLGDEPIPLGDAVGVDLYATDQDASVVANWGECTVVTAGDGRVSYVFQVDDLEGATSIDVVWRIRWQGGQSLVPTSPLNLPVA